MEKITLEDCFKTETLINKSFESSYGIIYRILSFESSDKILIYSYDQYTKSSPQTYSASLKGLLQSNLKDRLICPIMNPALFNKANLNEKQK